MLKWVWTGLPLVFLALLVLASGHGDYRPSNLDLTVAPYKYSLSGWELSNFLDKWTHKLGELMPWTSEPSREERIAQAKEFFDLGRRLEGLERRLQFPGVDDVNPDSASDVQAIRAEIGAIEKRRRNMQSTVEETIESEISAVLAHEGFASRIGLIFPPVDTVFSRPPGVLILSPRDRIHRRKTILMKPGLSDEVRGRIEERIFQTDNLSALVEDTGGLASYPSVVSDSGTLHDALVITAHEWLHHWFFFQPLGQHFMNSADMTTLNETAATLGGQTIGDRAFTAMAGEPVVSDPEPSPDPRAPHGFDFNAAMRETRLRTEELLRESKIEEAEAYMEERRLFLARNGHFIRKINQAFFAFHGSYATSAASVSPIDDQLMELKRLSDSLEDFIKTVSTFSSYQEFLDHLDAARRATGNVGIALPVVESRHTQGVRLERSFSEIYAVKPAFSSVRVNKSLKSRRSEARTTACSWASDMATGYPCPRRHWSSTKLWLRARSLSSWATQPGTSTRPISSPAHK